MHRYTSTVAMALALAICGVLPTGAQAQGELPPDEPAPGEEAPAAPAEAAEEPTAGEGEEGGSVEQEQTSLEAEQAAWDDAAAPSGAVSDTAAADGSDPEGPLDETYNHEGQLGIRAGFAMPYIFAVKYGEGPACSLERNRDGDPQTFCRRFGQPSLDLELGFGVSPTTELGLVARIGLTEDEVPEKRPFGLALGVRAYTSPDSVVKGYFGFRVLMGITSSDTPAVPDDGDWSTIDLGMRAEIGLQVDVARFVGLYMQLGESLSFLRGFYFVTDVGGGIQLRFP